LGTFTKEPLNVSKIKENYFSVNLEYDGPALSLTIPPTHRVNNGIIELVPGVCFYPSIYWDGAITKSRKPPDDLKSAYATIIKTIKRHLTRRKIDQNLWIGKNAFDLLREGKAIILSNGKWWNGKGDFVRSNRRNQ
jgi:hypothetical protein